jgi:hypothetical protein
MAGISKMKGILPSDIQLALIVILPLNLISISAEFLDIRNNINTSVISMVTQCINPSTMTKPLLCRRHQKQGNLLHV